jgi:hypothetical protein|tara:strand:+ start:48 stop:434 length:387 start_codon:yes stop_codon:yes gene_type:complete
MDDDNTPGELTDEFKNSMKEWVDLKTVLKNARGDIKIMNDREKNLKTYIKGFMKSNKIDQCNLRKGKVSLSTKASKKSLTADTIKKGLAAFFEGDEHRIIAAFDAIQDNREVTERQVLTLSGLKSVEE